MLTVTYEHDGCQDIRFFKNGEEFNHWLQRQLVINPDTEIIEIKEKS